MKIKIEVTQDDIDNGVHNECTECPVALAVKRVFPELDLLVFPTEIEINRDSNESFLRLELPEDARKFIRNFDFGLQVEPQSFEIELPDDQMSVLQQF